MFLLIPITETINPGLAKFTFHYVSTYTLLTVLTPCQHADLHSTMFLLIQNVFQYSPFAFIFTFHYVSTYTTEILSERLILSTFTFHYVSTYTAAETRTVIELYAPFTFHYVSTYTS